MSEFKVYRYLDGYEMIMVPCWMILRGEITLESDATNAYEKLLKELPGALSKYQCGRLSLHNVASKPQYVEAHKPVRVHSVDWVEAAAPGAVDSHKVPAMDEWVEGEPLVIACVAQRGKEVQLTVKASHTICDGRTVEGIYRIVASVLDSTVPAPPDAPLPAFGQRGLFTMTDEQASQVPKIWGEIPRNKPIHPPIPEGAEAVNLNTYVRYEWEPVRKYCKEHGVGTQSMLMAAACRANRKYNKFAANMPIYVSIPGDTRRSPVATAEHAKREVFSGSSVVLVRDDGCEDALEEIIGCNNGVRATQKTSDMALNVTFFGGVVNPETGDVTPSSAYPSGGCPIILVSNVGVYKYVKNPRLFSSIVVRGSSISIYSYSSGSALEVLVIYPVGMDQALVDATVAEMDEIFALAGSKRC